jgi:hypothetical protein
MRLIHFLFDALGSLGWILASARFCAYLHNVTSPKGLQINLGQGGRFRNCFHIEQFCTVRTNLREVAWSSVKRRAPFRTVRVGRVEDEQCQKIGGGYKAVMFRFLLFL